MKNAKSSPDESTIATFLYHLENTHTKNPSPLYNNFADRKNLIIAALLFVRKLMKRTKSFFSARRTNCVILRAKQKYEEEEELKDLCQGLLEHESEVF